MKLKSLKVLCLFFFIFFVLTTQTLNVFADSESTLNTKGAFTISPFVGGYLFDGVQNLKSRPYYGLRPGYNITDNVGIEAMFGYVRTRKITPDERAIDVYRYGIDGQYRFTTFNKKIWPFFSLGLGVVSFNNPSVNKNHSLGLLNYGPGFMATISDRIGFRFDLRQIIIADDFKSNYEATVGLIFSFPCEKSMKKEEVKEEVKKEKAKEVKNDFVLTEAILQLENTNTYFEYDSSKLRDKEKNLLKQAILIIKNNPKIKIRIEGHASAIGTEEYNQKLSEQRANAVKKYFIEEGKIDPARISTIGLGELKPIVKELHPEQKFSKEAKANMATVNFKVTD
ncbi:MAG: OmpA family protein [Oligoflexia bacterium]|nr:OmpA family protein [Oligoflexia bacterium]